MERAPTVHSSTRSTGMEVRTAQSRRHGRLTADTHAGEGRGPLDLAPRGRLYVGFMLRIGLLIGEVAAQSGLSRKALRLYEARGILLPPLRESSGYRRYPGDATPLSVLTSKRREVTANGKGLALPAVHRLPGSGYRDERRRVCRRPDAFVTPG